MVRLQLNTYWYIIIFSDVFNKSSKNRCIEVREITSQGKRNSVSGIIDNLEDNLMFSGLPMLWIKKLFSVR